MDVSKMNKNIFKKRRAQSWGGQMEFVSDADGDGAQCLT